MPCACSTIRWASLIGKTYQLQSATSLPSALWPNEGSAFAGTGDILTTNIPIAATPTKFFRLEGGD